MVARWLPLLLAAMVAAAQEGPVTNGGFEAGPADGAATDWSHVGTTVGYSPIARGGARSLRLWRAAGQEGEVGLNRDWTANSGQQGKMLVELKGAVIYWYRAEALDGAEMQFQIIPMTADAWEKTGSPRDIVTVPASHAGDGQWHRAVVCYDFTSDPLCRWVHVSARLTGPGAGEVLIDDVSYQPSFGPLPSLANLRLLPGTPDRFTGGALTAIVTNAGDAPCGPVTLSVEAPAGLTVGPPDRGVDGLAPDTFTRVTWPLLGARTAGGQLTVTARAGDSESIAAVALAPKYRLEAVLVDPSRPVLAEPLTVTVLVDNLGTAPGELRVIGEPIGFEPAGPVMLPGKPSPTDPRRTVFTWRLTPVRTTQQHWLTVRILDGDEQLAQEQFAVSPARTNELTWQAVAPGLDVAESPGGPAVGRVVAVGNRLAELPHLGEVIYRRGTRQVVVRAEKLTVEPGSVTSRVSDPDGGAWTFKLFARPGATPGTTRLSSAIRCSQPREVVALHGIDVLVPGARGEALLPGLEWLAPGELSGSDLDITYDHPQRMRRTPHPNRVTIPYLAAVTDRGVVGLLWDAHQTWLRGLDRPQPAFGSPDRWHHRAATRMALMAPNVPNGLVENALLAETPLKLAADEPVTFAAHLFASASAKSPLAVQEAWFRTYQPAPVLPYPRGGATDELAFQARGWLETMWIAEKQEWHAFLLGPAVMYSSNRTPAAVWDLFAFSRLAPGHRLAAAAGERAALIERLESRPPAAYDWGYLFGDPIAHLEGGVARSLSLLASREADGGWSYQPPLQNAGVFKGLDYLLLGEPGMKADGLFAARVMDALRPARLVGATELVDDAQPSLEALARFTIPRAAQVWEVPVHTPDILAAAEACEAFCEAYQLTGDRRWLEAARQEAYGGLAFIYVWNDAGKPWMRYGSIPVFGATLLQHSWLGNLVQWNGLSYARALTRLARLDDAPPPLGGLTWTELARGIMTSAMYQQRTDEGFVACWPDSLHTIDETRAAWEFTPRQILEIFHALLQRPEAPLTWMLPHGGAPARPLAFDRGAGDTPTATISACAYVTAASWQAETLRVTFAQPAAPMAVRATVAGVAKPTAVLLNGRPLAEQASLDGLTQPCYRYHELGATLALVLPADAEATVELRGAAPRRAAWRPPLVERLAFGFDTGAEGWRPHHHLAEPRVIDGVVHLRSTGGDPYFVRDGCSFAPDTVRRIRIRMQSSLAGSGQLYWTTAQSPAYAEDKVLHFVAPTGGMGEVVLEVADHPLWRGQRITGLRLDPVNGGTGVDFLIDSVIGE